MSMLLEDWWCFTGFLGSISDAFTGVTLACASDCPLSMTAQQQRQPAQNSTTEKSRKTWGRETIMWTWELYTNCHPLANTEMHKQDWNERTIATSTVPKFFLWGILWFAIPTLSFLSFSLLRKSNTESLLCCTDTFSAPVSNAKRGVLIKLI